MCPPLPWWAVQKAGGEFGWRRAQRLSQWSISPFVGTEAVMALIPDPVVSPPAGIGRVLTRVGRAMLRSIVAARLRQLACTLRHRREADILAGLDEHMLADIGLNRADLRDAFSEPIWRDPTSLLVQRADERRIRGRDRTHSPSASPPPTRPRVPAFAPPPLERAARPCV